MNALAAILRRDVTLAYRAGGGALQAAMFFALVAVIFALAIGPDTARLSVLAAPILWAGALLSALVSLDRIFQADFEDGSLDVIIETSEFLEATTLAKAAAHWIASCLPLIAATPALGLLLNLPPEGYWPMTASLVLGTPALSLIGAAVAAVALALRRAGVLVSILATPLYTPALIFGVGAAQAGAAGGDFAPALMLLTAVTLFSLIVAPLAAAAAIRFNMS